jgi:glycosyltransferase involved in cell wall biosynthesis
MKVLFTFGGLPHYYNYVLSSLNDVKDLEIVVVVPAAEQSTLGSGVKQTSDGINFEIIYLPEYKTPYGNMFFKGLDRIILAEKPDIVVSIWPYILGFVYYYGHFRLLKKLGIKLILKEIPFKVPEYGKAMSYYQSDEHLLMNENLVYEEKVNLKFKVKYKLLNWVRKFYYSRMVDATVNYTPDAQKIIGSYGLPPESIFITGNSPDTERIEQARQAILHSANPPQINKHRIIHVGRLVKWKKVDLILDAMHLLKKEFPQLELVIIGNGPEQKNLQKKALDLELTSQVIFRGGVYDNETLGRELMSSLVYVLAGMGGLSINEAMAFGKPIVCSIADGTEKHLLRNNINGLYFRDNDARDLADKLSILLKNPQKAIDQGEKSLQIIQKEMNIHTVIKGYVRAFNYVCGTQINPENKKEYDSGI